MLKYTQSVFVIFKIYDLIHIGPWALYKLTASKSSRKRARDKQLREKKKKNSGN